MSNATEAKQELPAPVVSEGLPTVRVQCEGVPGGMLVNRSDYVEGGAFPPSAYPLFDATAPAAKDAKAAAGTKAS